MEIVVYLKVIPPHCPSPGRCGFPGQFIVISKLRVDDLLTSPRDGDVCCKQQYSQLKMQSAQWYWTHLSLSYSLLQSALYSSLQPVHHSLSAYL